MAQRPGVDPAELVGPGAYDLRIQPAAALMPGHRDSRRLLTVWFIRKSFYWMFFLGWAVASLITYLEGNTVTGELNLSSPQSARDGLGAPGLALIIAIGIRWVNNWIAVALAYPLAVAHEPNLSPRDGFGSGIGKFLDRLQIARAFRALRWSHHVRQIALKRLGSTGRALGRLDPILDIVNIVVAIGGLLVVGILSGASGN